MPGIVVTAFALAQIQSGSAAAPSAPLLPTARTTGCAPAPNGDIVVCGKRDTESYRLRPLPPLPEHRSVLTKPMDVKIGPIHWHGLSATIDF